MVASEDTSDYQYGIHLADNSYSYHTLINLCCRARYNVEMLLCRNRITDLTNYNQADRIVLTEEKSTKPTDTKLSLKQNLSKTFKPDIDVIFIYLLLFTVYFNAMFKGGFIFYWENQQKLKKNSRQFCGENQGGITMAGWFSNL